MVTAGLIPSWGFMCYMPFSWLLVASSQSLKLLIHRHVSPFSPFASVLYLPLVSGRSLLRSLLDRVGAGEEGRMIWNNSFETYILPFVKQSVRIRCLVQGTQSRCSVTTWRDGVGWEFGGGFRREGTQVYLWPIHVAIWQKPSQYCKIIILQLKA